MATAAATKSASTSRTRLAVDLGEEDEGQRRGRRQGRGLAPAGHPQAEQLATVIAVTKTATATVEGELVEQRPATASRPMASTRTPDARTAHARGGCRPGSTDLARTPRST